MSYDEHLITQAGGDGDRLAKVLEQHAPSGVSGFGFEYLLCRCDRTNWMKAYEFPAHQAAMLTAAGIGVIA